MTKFGHRSAQLRRSAIVAWVLPWLGATVVAHGAVVRPNVLFIAIDDLRPALGAYGDPLAQTPHLDRLAQRGLVFERAYCQHALCAPSRASVMTGRRPERFPKISAGGQDAHYREVLPDVVTLPQLFKQHGYHTESIGKVNHVYPPILDPVSWSVPERLADIVKRDEYLRPENRVGGFIDPVVKGEATESIAAPDDAYVDGQAADAAIEALRRLQHRTFFLAVGTKRPHLPWTAPERYWKQHAREAFALAGSIADPFPPDHMRQFPWRYEWSPATGEMRGYSDIPAKGDVSPAKILELRHGYYASVSYVDAQVGRIIDELDRLKLAGRTIVVLWSDHGFHLGENGQWGKKSNTELDLRVPLIVIAPGQTKPGSRTPAMVELVDLYPTLAELAGLPREPGLEGTSFVPVLNEPQRPWKNAVFSQYIRNGVAGRAVRTDWHRYVEWTRLSTGERVDAELYDLKADPLERHNRAASDTHGAAGHARLLREGWKAAVPDVRYRTAQNDAPAPDNLKSPRREGPPAER
jgi:iduronate 2-sulfatase